MASNITITLGGKQYTAKEPTVWTLAEIEDAKVDAAEAQIQADKASQANSGDIPINETNDQRTTRILATKLGRRAALAWHIALVNAALNQGKDTNDTSRVDASTIPFATPEEFALAAYDVLVFVGQIKPGESQAQSEVPQT